MDKYFKKIKPGNKKKRILKPVYQFDIEGKFIYRHKDVKTASENLFIAEKAILTAIQRRGFCKGQWYFSHSKEFTNPQVNKNPVFSGGPKKYLDFDSDLEYDF